MSQTQLYFPSLISISLFESCLCISVAWLQLLASLLSYYPLTSWQLPRLNCIPNNNIVELLDMQMLILWQLNEKNTMSIVDCPVKEKKLPSYATSRTRLFIWALKKKASVLNSKTRKPKTINLENPKVRNWKDKSDVNVILEVKNQKNVEIIISYERTR